MTLPRRQHPRFAVTLLGAALAATPAGAVPKSGGGGLLPGSTGKEPVSIDAGKLDYFDKEQKLVYSGDVVARQGASTLKGSVLTIILAKGAKAAEPAAGATPPSPAAAAAAAAGPAGSSSIERMDVAGPVTVMSQDDVGTGDSGSYSRAANTITLTGHVTLTQATNIIKGDKLVYDMTTGQARVSSGETEGRVRSVFTPGSGSPGAAAPAKRPKSGAQAGAPVKPPATAAKSP